MELSGINHTVYSFARSENDTVKFSFRQYGKRLYLDIRIWFRPEEAPPEQELWPTRKGILLTLDQIKDFEKGLSELAQALPEFKAQMATLNARNNGQGNAPKKFQPAKRGETQESFYHPPQKPAYQPKN